MLIASVGVFGRQQFFHFSQQRIAGSYIRLVEVRPKSNIYFLIGNTATDALPVSISANYILVDGSAEFTLPPKTKVAIPVSLTNKKIPGSLHIEGTDFWLALTTNVQERLGYYSTDLPNPFPQNGPSLLTTESEEIEKNFFELKSVALTDIMRVSSDPIELPDRIGVPVISGPNTSEKAGYVYILSHPLFENWVKIGSTIDLAKRLCTYQTADPLRRFSFHAFHEVDDRLAIEKWVLHCLSKSYQIEGEWIKCPLKKVLKETETAIKLIKGEN